MKHLLKNHQNLRHLPHLIFIVFLILVFWSVFSWQNRNQQMRITEEITLNIKILNDSNVMLDDQSLTRIEFADQLKTLLAQLNDSGISNDHITCTIGAKGNTKVESVADIQRELRHAGLNRLKYVKYR